MYREEVIESGCKVVHSDSEIPSIMVKTITYMPRVFVSHVPILEFNERELEMAKNAVSRHMSEIIIPNMKYMTCDDRINNRREYRISVSVLMEKEKVDFIEKIENLEQSVRNLRFTEERLMLVCSDFRNESLWIMIKRWWTNGQK